jgi:hypothetical protein
MPPAEWEIGLLSILPKKGDLSNPNNYRGIMMLEVAYKIVANILLTRLKPIKESIQLDHESQNGFRRMRGCLDSIFTLKQLIKKRAEHGLETWLLLIDLVKAFDRVPRELLWEVMLKQGVPPKLVSLLKALHKSVKIKIVVDGVEKIIESIIGVKQGDILGPDLFIFFMAAVLKTWRSSYSHSYKLCTVRCKSDFILTGRRSKTKGELDTTVADSEYADDTAFTFESREDCEKTTPLIFKHFARWGLEVHVGTNDATSKSEILFCAKDQRCYSMPKTYDGVDLSPIRWGEGFNIPVVEHFKYLGSYLSRNCRDDHDVHSRIISAGNAFGSLRKSIFSSCNISTAAKHSVYTSVILSILLYGCECWSLTEQLLDRLRVFHNQCIRSMCRVTRKHTWEHRISSAELRARIGLHPIEFYIYHRQLFWLGNVSRMDFSRLPRRMLSCWIPSKRPVGRPRFTYGETVRKALQQFGFTDENYLGFTSKTLHLEISNFS